MITALRYFAILTVAVVLNACAAIPVSTDYDPNWQLPSPASYAWMKRPAHKADPMVDNDLVAARVQRAVDEQLEAIFGLVSSALGLRRIRVHLTSAACCSSNAEYLCRRRPRKNKVRQIDVDLSHFAL